MQQIYPVSHERCKSHIGKTVCAVLQDGRYYVGTITGVNERGIELNGGYSKASVLSTKPAKAKKQLQGMQAKAKTKGVDDGYWGNGYPGYGFGWGFGLEWAAIALLFLIPFLFI